MAYRLISLLLYPFWLLHGWRHGKQRGRSDYLRLRLAKNLPATSAELTWLHAASVGEVEAITPLANHYLAAGKTLLITSFTASGLNTIEKKFGARVSASVIPIDSPGPCQRFFDHFSITRGLILETELWPHLIQSASQRNIPLVLANARLSKKSTGNPLARSILSNTAKGLTRILCRNESDREHFIEIGAESAKIEVVGNLKAAARELEDQEPLIDRPYLLLASSHDPEETEFLQRRPDHLAHPLLVIAPRHPERSKLLQQMLSDLKVSFAVRSLNQKIEETTEVYLADTLGELTFFMQHATVVVMGGSFEGTGGHNLHEPARLGCAIITGPSDSNIKEDIDWLQPGTGIIQVASIDDAWREIQDMLENPVRPKTLGDNARRLSMQKSDVLSSYVRAIDSAFDQHLGQA